MFHRDESGFCAPWSQHDRYGYKEGFSKGHYGTRHDETVIVASPYGKMACAWIFRRRKQHLAVSLVGYHVYLYALSSVCGLRIRVGIAEVAKRLLPSNAEEKQHSSVERGDGKKCTCGRYEGRCWMGGRS